jgi:hypothetical protein
MKTNTQSKQVDTQAPARPMNPVNQVQGFIANPQVFLSRDGESLIHRLPGNMRFELHVNLYKKILGGEFTPKERRPMGDESQPRARLYGFFAQPEIFLTRDGQHLIHRALGVRISKHVNFYKQILGIPYQPKAATAGAEAGAVDESAGQDESQG